MNVVTWASTGRATTSRKRSFMAVVVRLWTWERSLRSESEAGSRINAQQVLSLFTFKDEQMSSDPHLFFWGSGDEWLPGKSVPPMHPARPWRPLLVASFRKSTICRLRKGGSRKLQVGPQNCPLQWKAIQA